MSDEKVVTKPEEYTYTIQDKSPDGRIFEVTMTSGPNKGRSATMCAISSEFAYYNVGKYAKGGK